MYLTARSCSNFVQPFWFDELINYYLASSPSIRQIWPLIGQGIELNPPLPFWLTWIVHHTLGRGEVLTRTPALAGYWLMCLCLFQFVRRRSDVRHGFLALLLPVFTYTSREATFARGYGLMLGASAAALLSWQYAAAAECRVRALPALALSIGVAVSCHYYACLVALALLLGEFLRSVNRRRIDWPVLTAIFIGFSPLFAYWPLIHALPGAARTFWVTPSVEHLYSSYADLLGPVTIVFFLLIVVSLRHRVPVEHKPTVDPVLEEHEWAVVLLLLAMPLLIFVGALISPLAFYTRYVQPVVIGFSIAFPLFAYRVAAHNRRLADTAISLLVYLCFLPWAAFHICTAFVAPPATAAGALRNVPTADGPIVVENDDDYLRSFHYSGPELQMRLFYLLDTSAAVRYLGSDTGLHSLTLLETFHDVHARGYEAFVRDHRQFLLFECRPGWIVQKLLADGARLELLREDKPHGVFVRAARLFQVKLPDHAHSN
jgi:4-amino-4-deoxy-L-arabinose transferase-like glycosyltransferase